MEQSIPFERNASSEPQHVVAQSGGDALLAQRAALLALLGVADASKEQSGPHTLAQWLQTLTHPSGMVRRTAVESLEGYLPDVPVGPLVHMAEHDNDDLVREAAVALLGQMYPHVPLNVLLTACQDRDASVRAMALQALASFEEAIPLQPLIQALDDPFWFVRQAAIATLGHTGRSAPIDVLIKTLADECELVREEVAHSLRMLESSDRVQALFAAYQQATSEERAMALSFWKTCAALALEHVKQQSAFDSIQAVLEHSHHPYYKELMYYLLARAVNEINARTALAPLVATLQESTFPLRTQMWSALCALAQQLLREQQQVAILLSASQATNFQVRQETEQALIELVDLALKVQGPRRETTSLVTALAGPDPILSERMMRTLAAQALHVLEEQNAPALRTLLVALQDDDPQRRATAAHVLAERARQAIQEQQSPSEPMVVSWKSRYQETATSMQIGTTVRPKHSGAGLVLSWRDYWQDLSADKPVIAHLAVTTERQSAAGFAWN